MVSERALKFESFINWRGFLPSQSAIIGTINWIGLSSRATPWSLKFLAASRINLVRATDRLYSSFLNPAVIMCRRVFCCGKMFSKSCAIRLLSTFSMFSSSDTILSAKNQSKALKLSLASKRPSLLETSEVILLSSLSTLLFVLSKYSLCQYYVLNWLLLYASILNASYCSCLAILWPSASNRLSTLT